MSLPRWLGRWQRARARGIPAAVGRISVWREVLGTGWLGLSVALAAGAVVAFHHGWKLPGAAARIDARWAALVLVFVSLLAGVLEGAHRAVARRERKLAERKQELERLFRTPLHRLVQAKYHLHRDASVCMQLVEFLTMSRTGASAMTPEAALGIEHRWGGEFLERFQRMFGEGTFGDVFNRMGGMFPPPRDRAIPIYVGLADFLHLLAERITESDLDPAYLHGRDESPPARPGASIGPMSLPADDEALLLLHNPRCSKSRAAKSLLEERGARFALRLYLEEPLSPAELAELRRRLDRPAREWARQGEPAWGAAGLDPESDDAAVLDALAKHPELLERPILVRGGRAVIGRPPEQVLELL